MIDVAHLALFEGTYSGSRSNGAGGSQEGDLVSALSLYASPVDGGSGSTVSLSVQLRKFATEAHCRGRGYGSILLEQAKQWAAKCSGAGAGAVLLWCDARAEQEGFYLKRGFKRQDPQPGSNGGDASFFFMKKGRKYVRMECGVEAAAAAAAAAEGETAAALSAEGKVVGTGQGGEASPVVVRVMGKEDVCRWLMATNKAVGRGSEFRSAAKHMGWTPPPPPPPPPPIEGEEGGGDGPAVPQREPRPSTIDDLLDDGFLSWGAFWGLCECKLTPNPKIEPNRTKHIGPTVSLTHSLTHSLTQTLAWLLSSPLYSFYR